MPITPTYPGVYIDEAPSGVHTITPVATSITAFIGSAPRGIANDPLTVQSFAEYQRKFGGLHRQSPMGYAVWQYFQNGGSDALIVRVVHPDAVPAKIEVGGLPLEAAGAGAWGNRIRARIDLNTRPGDDSLFNLFLYDDGSKATEEYRNLSIDPDSPRYFQQVLEEGSELARIQQGATPSGRPTPNGDAQPNTNWFDDANLGAASTAATGGDDGGAIDDGDIVGQPADKTGLSALEKADLFNLLCIPPIAFGADVDVTTYAAALAYCKSRRAMLLVDAPAEWTTVDAAERQIDGLRGQLGDEPLTRNAAVYFPRLKMSDPLRENRLAEFVPCGAVAGICARTDVARGVWKAPAGIDAGFSGVREFTIKTMTDPENGRLNPLGVNCLRTFRTFGNLIWGARTLAGSDVLGSDYKYVPVRRFTLFLEESLYRGTQWVVFEPNDEPLWALIRLNIGAFMHDLFRQGAFQGTTPSDAYYVKCDGETTTQTDINRGIVNIEVGFAPLKPAEFVIITIKQIAGQIDV